MIPILKFGQVAKEELFARISPIQNVTDAVSRIIADVQDRGDAALLAYTSQFDGAQLEKLEVSVEEIETTVANVEPRH